MREPTPASIARRFQDAVAAAVRGLAQVIEGALPMPQPVPVRVAPRGRRSRG